MNARLHWNLLPFDSRAGVLPSEWQQLNERRFGAHPLLDADFLGPLLREYGDDSIRLARLDDGGDVLGLALVRRVRPGKWALFQPDQAPLGPIMVDLERVDASGAIAGLLTSLPGLAAELELTFLDPQFSPLPPQGPCVEWIPYATTMGVETTGSFDEYWAARKKQLRYNLRNYQKRLVEAGIEPRFEVITEPDRIAWAVDDYGDLESRGWKAALGTAIHRSNSQGKVYREIMRGFAERGSALATRMLIGDRLVAGWLIIVSGGMAVMLKTTFDESLSDYAVGRVVLFHTLRHLFERDDIRVVEFYTKANAVQLQWSTISRPTYHANIYRYPVVHRSRRLLRAVARPFKRRRKAVAEAPGT